MGKLRQEISRLGDHAVGFRFPQLFVAFSGFLISVVTYARAINLQIYRFSSVAIEDALNSYTGIRDDLNSR